jgi:hypothetical protein
MNKEYQYLIILLFPFFIWSELYEKTDESVPEDSTNIVTSAQKTDEIDEYEKLRAEIDSLRTVSEILKKESQSLKDSETDNENESDLSFRKKMREIKDTIQILTLEGAKSFLGSFTSRKRNTRERGFGGGLGPVIGLYTINTKPIVNLINTVPRLSNFRSKLDGSFKNFVLMGGMGYGAVGNGLRIGGGGRGGAKKFSNILQNDTTHTLEISIGFGGFLLEKCFVTNKMNFFLGGMAGGGRIDATDFKLVGTDTNDDDDHEQRYTNEFDAGFMMLEFHGGFTYTLISWLHMGLDISMPFFISSSGFESKAGIGIGEGFMTINPGLRIRIMFGNIG